MGVIFSAARAAILAAPAFLNSKKYWSLAALVAVNESKFLPLTRDGTTGPSPHTQMKLHGHSIDEKEGPSNFLFFGQVGWIYKKK